MYPIRVILYHNRDKSFAVALRRNLDECDFIIKVFQPLYTGFDCFNTAYNYAYHLSNFLECDFVEIKS